MPEREFDFYLSLLGRFLGLKPDQREQIAAELRDHLEERLEELMRRGGSREEAIRSALEEFGDAAGLAASFTRVANTSQRRAIMRCTAGVIGAATAAVVLVSLMWPEQARMRGPSAAVAQQAGGDEPKTPSKGDEPSIANDSSDADRVAAVEGALAKRMDSLNFVETPFSDALEFLSDHMGVDILIDQKYLDENGIGSDSPVTLEIKHSSVKAKTALELLLEKAGGDSLGYTIRDGMIYVSEKYDAAEIQVYNCRDLFEQFPNPNAQTGGLGGEVAGVGLPGGFAGGFGGPISSGMGEGIGGMGMGSGASQRQSGPALVQVILTTIHPDTWAEVGGKGSVEEFHGLLIVKHSQTVHREIRQLLAMMRQAAQEKTGPLTPSRVR